MKKTLITITLVLLSVRVFAWTSDDDKLATNTDRSLISTHGNGTDRPSYMGMAALDLSPFIPIHGIAAVAPNIGVHTSHGAFFPKSGLYVGMALEYSGFWNILTATPHLRWHYCTKKRTAGYIGAEAGVGFLFPAFGSKTVGYTPSGGVEIGCLINFRKVSLDLGLRFCFLDVRDISGMMMMPIRIGIVF